MARRRHRRRHRRRRNHPMPRSVQLVYCRKLWPLKRWLHRAVFAPVGVVLGRLRSLQIRSRHVLRACTAWMM